MGRYYSKRNKRHVSAKRKLALQMVGKIRKRKGNFSYHNNLWYFGEPYGRDWVTWPIQSIYFDV